jgi:hypothetical protein
MASLEQVLASVPGLAGYQAQVNQNNQTTLGNIQQAHGVGGILAQIAAQARAQRQAPMQDALLEAQVGEHRAKAKKLEQEAAFNAQITSMGGTDALSPDQLEALGMRANMAGLSSGTGLMKMAELKRERAAQQASVQGMQGRLVADVPAETEAQAIERVKAASAAGQPASVGFGENPNVIPRREGGVAEFLMGSPYVGPAAKALQQRIDSGQLRDPKQIEMWMKELNKSHIAQSGMQTARDQRPVKPDPASVGAADATPGDFTKQGAQYLDSLPEEDRNMVKKIAGYEIDPKTLSTKGGHRERVLRMVSQYAPEYDDTQYANKRRAIAQFGSGPQGNTVRSLNVAIEHIDTLQRAAVALKNGDFTPGNKTYNEFVKIFGQSPPNTFEGIRDIVANEVVKGTIGNAGALQDRAEAAAKVKASASPEQLNQLMNGWTELMGGQVKGLSQQYEGATGLKDFRDRYLTQRTRDAIALAEGNAGGDAPKPERRAEPRPTTKRTVVNY